MHRSKHPLHSITKPAASLDVARSLTIGPAIGSAPISRGDQGCDGDSSSWGLAVQRHGRWWRGRSRRPCRYYNMAHPLASVTDLIQALETLGWVNQPHAHIRYWFRGHSKPGWLLQPTVYRPSFGSFIKEDDRFNKECHLNQDFTVMSAGLRTGHETSVDLYFLQQHYRMPTRLLDWTNNPLAALYFACS